MKEVSNVEIMKVSETEGNTIGVVQAVRGKHALENILGEEEGNNSRKEGKRQYIQIDGGMVNTREEDWKEVKLGCLFNEDAVVEVNKNRNEIINKRYFGYIGGVEEFEPIMWENVRKLISDEDEIVVMGDGARWIWNLSSKNFPFATEIVDFYHAEEHLWDLGEEVFGEENKECKEWVEDKKEKLLQRDVDTILKSLNELAIELNNEKKKKVEKEYKYF